MKNQGYEKAKEAFKIRANKVLSAVEELKDKMSQAKTIASKNIADANTKLAKITAEKLVNEAAGNVDELKKLEKVEKQTIAELALHRETIQYTQNLIDETVNERFSIAARDVLQCSEASTFFAKTTEAVKGINESLKDLIEQKAELEKRIQSMSNEVYTIMNYDDTRHIIKQLGTLSGALHIDEGVSGDRFDLGLLVMSKDPSVVFSKDDQIKREVVSYKPSTDETQRDKFFAPGRPRTFAELMKL